MNAKTKYDAEMQQAARAAEAAPEPDDLWTELEAEIAARHKAGKALVSPRPAADKK